MISPARVLRCVILVLALLAPVPLLAAGFTCAAPADSGRTATLDEPKEAAIKVIEGTQSAREMQAWLKLLVGRFTWDGYVDLCGKGNVKDQRPVTGRADCIASGTTPNVHCKVNVSWPATTRENGAPVPGGVSNLAPAEFVFSIEAPRPPTTYGEGVNGWGLVLLQLDNKANAEWFSGVLKGDTFTSTEHCIDIPGDCHKTTRITARPDSDEITMRVDVTIDRERKLRQAFLLHRVPK